MWLLELELLLLVHVESVGVGGGEDQGGGGRQLVQEMGRRLEHLLDRHLYDVWLCVRIGSDQRGDECA